MQTKHGNVNTDHILFMVRFAGLPVGSFSDPRTPFSKNSITQFCHVADLVPCSAQGPSIPASHLTSWLSFRCEFTFAKNHLFADSWWLNLYQATFLAFELLQGRLPIRVELKALTQEDFYRILTEPEYSIIKQQQVSIDPSQM